MLFILLKCHLCCYPPDLCLCVCHMMAFASHNSYANEVLQYACVRACVCSGQLSEEVAGMSGNVSLGQYGGPEMKVNLMENV